MDSNFCKIRFALFTKSYAGYFFTDQIKHLKFPDRLIEKLAKVLLLNKKLLRCVMLHKTCRKRFFKVARKASKDNEKINVYLQIEKELITLIQVRTDKDSLVSEDYEYALLAPAIERVAGDTLANIKSDSEFEKRLPELRRKYHRWYYAVAYRYRLPTIRIIPFLQRMVTIDEIVSTETNIF